MMTCTQREIEVFVKKRIRYGHQSANTVPEINSYLATKMGGRAVCHVL